MFRSLSAAILPLVFLSACSQNPTSHLVERDPAAGLRPLTQAERAEDFDQMVTLFKTYYGPYSFKERFLGIKVDNLAAGLRSEALAAKTDEEFAGVVARFIAALRDGHVSFQMYNSASGVAGYKVPVLLVPVEDRFVIGDIADDLKQATGLAIGDEVLEVDGEKPASYLPTILEYRSMAGDESNAHAIASVFSRPSYMTELVPSSTFVSVKAVAKDGVVKRVEIPWEVRKYNSDRPKMVAIPPHLDLRVPFADDLNSIVGHIEQMGKPDSFFLTPQSQAVDKFVRVYPSDASRKAFGLEEKEKPPIFAALYRHQGKTILLMRNATYSPSDFKSSVYLKGPGTPRPFWVGAWPSKRPTTPVTS